MAFDELMGLTNRLLAHSLALSAIAARLHLDELGAEGDPALREQLDRVLDELGVREQLGALTEQQRAVVYAFARSYLAQGLDLVDDPARPSSWSHSDPVLLRAQGSASAVVATLLSEELRVTSPGMRILDVGTGVAGLATAFCREIPDATVVGVDPWAPALELARENVVAAGLEDRVTLVQTTIQDFDDPDGFDLAWLPSFFLPESVLADAAVRVFDLLRPGGRVVVGVTFADAEEGLGAVTDDLMTVRSGGSVLDPAGAVALLESTGFSSVGEVDRTWNPPLRFVVGTRA